MGGGLLEKGGGGRDSFDLGLPKEISNSEWCPKEYFSLNIVKWAVEKIKKSIIASSHLSIYDLNRAEGIKISVQASHQNYIVVPCACGM